MTCPRIHHVHYSKHIATVDAAGRASQSSRLLLRCLTLNCETTITRHAAYSSYSWTNQSICLSSNLSQIPSIAASNPQMPGSVCPR